MQKHKNRHRKWAALLCLRFRTKVNSFQGKPHDVKITRLILFNYASKTSTHTGKQKSTSSTSCFTHVTTTLGSSSTHTRLISSNILVHLTDFYVLHKPSRAECCPVNDHKCSTSKLFFSSSIKFQCGPENKRTQWGHPGTAWPPPVLGVIVTRCRFSRKSHFLLQTCRFIARMFLGAAACVNRAADLLTSHIFIYCMS